MSANLNNTDHLPLVHHSDPILKQKLVDFNFDQPLLDPIDLYNQLGTAMIQSNGIGLSANQLGLPFRVFVMRGAEGVIGCFNPIIVDVSEELIALEEGCLSYPGLLVKIKRPRYIKVRFTAPDGEIQTHKYANMTARVFQHEFDHMEGLNFINRASGIHRERAVSKLRKLDKVNNLKNILFNKSTRRSVM